MKPAPASFTPSSASGAAQIIGLFLARLWAALLRLEASQAAIAPAEAAAMVRAGEAMVHAFIRGLAATELQAAGFPGAAKALRVACADGAGATSPTHMDPVSPAELTRRLEASLLMFERAEALAHQLACMMVCALGLASSQSRGAGLHTEIKRGSAVQTCRVGLGPRGRGLVGQGPPYRAHNPWPPPISSVGNLLLTA